MLSLVIFGKYLPVTDVTLSERIKVPFTIAIASNIYHNYVENICT